MFDVVSVGTVLAKLWIDLYGNNGKGCNGILGSIATVVPCAKHPWRCPLAISNGTLRTPTCTVSLVVVGPVRYKVEGWIKDLERCRGGRVDVHAG